MTFLPFLCLAGFVATFRHARKSDLIHGHWVVGGLIAGLAGLLLRRPVVTTFRGMDYTWARKYAVARRLLYYCLCLNRRVITVSREMARQLAVWFPGQRHKIVCIPNGVDISLTAVSRPKPEQFTLAVIGNLIPRKKVDVVVDSFAHLASSVPASRLLVVGDGPERGFLEKLVGERGLERQVAFLGLQDPQHITDILRSSNAMVLASESEGRPNVVLEAMAAGVPVIASDIDGVREIIQHEHNGLLFPVGDVERLAACMARLRDDRELGDRLAANARQWIDDQELSWSQTARKYTDVYHQVIQEFQQGRAVCAE